MVGGHGGEVPGGEGGGDEGALRALLAHRRGLLRGVALEASFKSTRLTGASFSKAKMRDTRFADCHLVAADLRGVSLHKQTLRHVDLSEANLSGADLRDAVLEGCRLRDARMVDARFAGADLRRCDLGCSRRWRAAPCAGR
ncbi:MAG: pentapeptide repeat-containing protein [Deltaproteobacteria bacterium]|nr:pentapeptide repeat-containing protein [Deltaproteobacteria bacterium]